MASPDRDDGTPRVYHADNWTASDAALTFCLALGTYLAVPLLFGRGLAPLIVAQLLGLTAVPLVVLRARALPPATIGLTRPPLAALAGALLVGASLWYLNARLTAPWARLVGDDDLDALRALLRETPFAIALLSIVPAISEELATRGVLALGLARRLGALAAVLISAAAFALLHFSLLRALPTFVLGAVLATITLRTGSVVPAIVAHAVNNAIALVLASSPRAPVARAIDAHPTLALALAAALSATGIALSRRVRETRL